MPRRKSGDKVVMLSFRVNCGLQSLLRKFVHDRRQQEYTSTGQVMRDALEKFLKEKFADLADPDMNYYSIQLALLQANKSFDESIEEETVCERFMEKTSMRVDKLRKDGAHSEIRRLLAKAKQDLHAMPDNYWTRRLRKEWLAQFGSWVMDIPVTAVPSQPSRKANGKEDLSDRISTRPDDFESVEAEE